MSTVLGGEAGNLTSDNVDNPHVEFVMSFFGSYQRPQQELGSS